MVSMLDLSVCQTALPVKKIVPAPLTAIYCHYVMR